MEATTATRRSTTAGTGTAISQEDNTSPLAHVATGAVLIRQPASLSTHPLVSALSAAYVLGVLYLPRRILSLLLSPALVSALLLLATLLYFGSPSRQDHRQSRSPELRQHFHSEDQQRRRRRQERHQPRAFPQPAATPDTDHNSPAAVLCSVQKPLLLAEHHHFVECPRWGPLEVIYEEYEGGEEEEEEEDVGHSPAWPASGRSPGMERTALRCYSDDSDDDDSASYSVGGSSPAWDLPEDLFFRLDLEEEGLIEIPLGEDNLIEIDISACR